MLSIHLTLSRMLRNAVSGGEKGTEPWPVLLRTGLRSEDAVILQSIIYS